MKSKNTIEFNGTHYDTVTGHIVATASKSPAKTGNIDGFFRNPRQAGTNLAVASQVSQPTRTTPISTVVADIAAPITPRPKSARSIQPNHVHHHKAQPAATLMRQAVRKPQTGFKKQITVQSTMQSSVPSLIATKKSVHRLDDQRANRAMSTEKSPQVTRHTPAAAPTITALVQPVPVKPEASEPAHVPAPQHTNKPVDIFEQAMANAGNFVDVKAHRKHFKKQTKIHLSSVAAGTLALLVIGGFATYINSPSLQVKMASVQAGVSTTSPNFTAAGFAYNGASSSDGKLKLGFSGQNGNYELVQQKTNWDSQDMINNVGATDASGFPTYSTVQADGTTVYRTSNTGATWVKDGNWYQVNGTGSLTDSQVTALVKNI